METNELPLVSIQCLVYNHEPYLRQCLDGFVMQKTNFKFEAIVHDDVSTDGSAAIIREYAEKYPDIIKPIFETENQYSKHDGSLDRIMNEACMGKYVAICEGDDYWIDQYKLQKQVDFMEANPDCSLCFTNIKILNEDTGEIDENPLTSYLNESLPKGKEELFYYIMLGLCRIQTVSVLYSSRYYSMIRNNDRIFLMGDTPLWLDLSQCGRFHYLQDKTAFYRVHTGSACRNPRTYNKFRLSMFEMRIYYCNKYGYKVPSKVKRDYNKCALKIMMDGQLNNIILPYPIYKMNFLQSLFVNAEKNDIRLKSVVLLIHKVEDIMYAMYQRINIIVKKTKCNFSE